MIGLQAKLAQPVGEGAEGLRATPFHSLREIEALLTEQRLAALLGALTADLDTREATLREAIADNDLDRAEAEVGALHRAGEGLGAPPLVDAARSLGDAIGRAASSGPERIAAAAAILHAVVVRTNRAISARLPGTVDVAG